MRGVEAFGLEGRLARWREIRGRIHQDVCRNGYDPALGSFVRACGSHELDASLLLLPAVGFLPPENPRVRGTIAAIERELVSDGLARRYQTGTASDGRASREGAFLACSFWLADGGGAAPPRAPALATERPRLAGRRARPVCAAHAGQLPAGLLARRAGEHRLHAEWCRDAGSALHRSRGPRPRSGRRGRPRRACHARTGDRGKRHVPQALHNDPRHHRQYDAIRPGVPSRFDGAGN